MCRKHGKRKAKTDKPHHICEKVHRVCEICCHYPRPRVEGGGFEPRPLTKAGIKCRVESGSEDFVHILMFSNDHHKNLV